MLDRKSFPWWSILRNGRIYASKLENTLTDKQIELLHAMLDIQSDTAADEMRAAYKAGFMDSMNLIKEIMG